MTTMVLFIVTTTLDRDLTAQFLEYEIQADGTKIETKHSTVHTYSKFKTPKWAE